MKKKYLYKITMLIVLAIIPFISACGTKDSNSLSYKIMTFLGFDMHDYENEVQGAPISSDDERYDEIVSIVRMLVSDSASIATFESPREAAAGNADAILSYMLSENYSAYTGNLELISKANEAYPQYNITTLIPVEDFESVVYKYFGGDESVKNKSSVRFTYLPKVGAYTTTGAIPTKLADIDVILCYETENTYRIRFRILYEGQTSPKYDAMLIKRDDGTMYMRFLREIEESTSDTGSAAK
ncbi:MAG TPA: hypothetical protein PKZ58_08515 [Bacillota bacterium]|nr:hypothetical protein [Clostridiales bacterium]HOQ15106.1 hypothetical protein [Bacillota bacterium]